MGMSVKSARAGAIAPASGGSSLMVKYLCPVRLADLWRPTGLYRPAD
jgi:hypothetical protein